MNRLIYKQQHALNVYYLDTELKKKTRDNYTVLSTVLTQHSCLSLILFFTVRLM